MTIDRPCNSAGNISIAGTLQNTASELISSGAEAIKSRQAGITRAASSSAYAGAAKATIGPTRWAWNSKAVITPKLLPAPRTAQKRSEERRVGKSVDLGGRRILKKKKKA